ncbi:LytR family transcriptional regulator [Leifsonia xyli subsp. cynodontis DSM 46306]|uniref:Cell envelope-related transcriptional attenuator domain-containing protein n=1 Tax=Leifsonia xyli subsp. cynodontis DSM 46306 TaxID=1389489 RepID=U3P6N1_LEIXC|nr:LCP family protein [Leifsonia xyli]AGW40582.1 LytR family transcriptional regulator [Leifsonia xyli subsp. cynodontis DSM 46306]
MTPDERPLTHRRRPIRHRAAVRRRRRLTLLIAGSLTAVLVAACTVTAYAYVDLTSSLHRSGFTLAAPSGSPTPTPHGEVNILVMGLDSRVDQNGDPLPRELYQALHAGDQSDGGYNANVLMLVHLPADGGKAVGISIPRDDYAPLSGAPDSVRTSKIKEAYGLSLDENLRALRKQGVARADAYQQARAAARQTQIRTVSDFLGGVRIDHFIEITMAAFERVAQAVQPITVCLNHATKDKYSGADFPAGMQELNAAQAMSFVRQRRDTGPSDLELTDLDRTRRQQAFILSLAHKLRRAETFTDLGTLQRLLDTAKQYIAVDDGFDLLSFAGDAQRLSGGGLSFQTLPVARFATVDGKSVNIVDPATIQGIVAGLLGTGSASPTPATAPPATGSTAPSPPALNHSTATTAPDAPLEAGGIPCVN